MPAEAPLVLGSALLSELGPFVSSEQAMGGKMELRNVSGCKNAYAKSFLECFSIWLKSVDGERLQNECTMEQHYDTRNLTRSANPCALQEMFC